MFDAFTILAAWPPVLILCVAFGKRAAKMFGRRESPLFVRTLPIHSELWGMASAPIVLELVDPLVAFVELGALAWWVKVAVCLFAGIAAGGVASKQWKLGRQGFAGDDRRLETRRNL